MDNFYSQFRTSDHAFDSIEKHSSRLPVGILTTEKKILREVTFRKLSREDLKKIWDRKFAQNHPIQWIARVICLVVDSIEGIPVHQAYLNAGSREIPSIVQEMPLTDNSYILVLGHIHNFGWEIQNVRTQCIDDSCERKQTIPVVSLKKMMVEISEENYHVQELLFSDGLQVPDMEDNKKKIPHRAATFRLPLLKDALKYENFYRTNDQGDFYERVYAECLERLATEKGDILSEDRMFAQGPALLKTMSAMDSALLEGAFNNVPQLLMVIQERCTYCSEDLPVFIQQGFLYPRRR